MKALFFCLPLLLVATMANGLTMISGKVTSFDVDNGTLEISGVEVAAGDLRIENLAGGMIKLSQLEKGDHIDVMGIVKGPGKIQAVEMKKTFDLQGKIAGEIDSADSAAKTVSIAGITVKIPLNAILNNLLGSDPYASAPSKMISFKDLTVGSEVECRGRWTGPREFTATGVVLE